MGSLQLRVVALCTLINMLDGFDVLVVAFTAAAIAEDWALSPARLGTLLSAGLVGMTLGSLVLGPVGDRFGRRPLVLLCLLMISLGMLLSAFSQTFIQLTATRILTGLGIGGMLPGINTLVAEFSSLRWRSFSVSLLQAGYPIGATLGGALVALYIDESGWRGVFLAAGLLSAALIPLVWRALPESLEFLLSRRPPGALRRVNGLLLRLGREPLGQLPPEPAGAGRTGYAELLLDAGLLRRSLLFCLAFFCVMFSFYFVLSWTPKLLVDAGMSTAQGISGGVILNVGGIFGSLLLGFLAARFRLPRLIAVYMLASAGLMLLFSGVSEFTSAVLLLALALGFCIFGAMVGLYALAPRLYPVSSRSAGLSLAIGVGRLGAVLSPALAGYLFDAGWERGDGYVAFAFPLLVAAGCVLVVGADAFALNSRKDQQRAEKT